MTKVKSIQEAIFGGDMGLGPMWANQTDRLNTDVDEQDPPKKPFKQFRKELTKEGNYSFGGNDNEGSNDALSQSQRPDLYQQEGTSLGLGTSTYDAVVQKEELDYSKFLSSHGFKQAKNNKTPDVKKYAKVSNKQRHDITVVGDSWRHDRSNLPSVHGRGLNHLQTHLHRVNEEDFSAGTAANVSNAPFYNDGAGKATPFVRQEEQGDLPQQRKDAENAERNLMSGASAGIENHMYQEFCESSLDSLFERVILGQDSNDQYRRDTPGQSVQNYPSVTPQDTNVGGSGSPVPPSNIPDLTKQPGTDKTFGTNKAKSVSSWYYHGSDNVAPEKRPSVKRHIVKPYGGVEEDFNQEYDSEKEGNPGTTTGGLSGGQSIQVTHSEEKQKKKVKSFKYLVDELHKKTTRSLKKEDTEDQPSGDQKDPDEAPPAFGGDAAEQFGGKLRPGSK